MAPYYLAGLRAGAGRARIVVLSMIDVLVLVRAKSCRAAMAALTMGHSERWTPPGAGTMAFIARHGRGGNDQQQLGCVRVHE